MLALRMGAAAVAVGLVAWAVAYHLETGRAEQAVLARASAGARHFESPAMQVLLDAAAPDGHGALERLLDRGSLLGIRVFNREGRIVYERWGEVATSVVESIRGHRHEWPLPGQDKRNWIDAAGERVIQVVLPMTGEDGSLLGYLEGVSRLDAETLRAQRERIRASALTAVASVLATASLLYPLMLAMLRRSNRRARHILDANLSLVRSLGNAVAKRDSDTDAHNYRVTLYAVALAETLGMPAAEISDLVVGAFLHDVGKIGIPDHILRKAGKLNRDEFETMKDHVLLGLDIISGNPWLEGATAVIRHHHERLDGTGYPDGLKGEAIPRNARIFAVADVFDALTSVRPYKAAMPLPEALAIIGADSGRQFDPVAAAAFLEIAPGLYERVATADEKALRREMRRMLSLYFRMERDTETGGPWSS